MWKGIDAAREQAPEHTKVLDDLKDQLLIVFIRRLGGCVSIPVSEIDDTVNFVGHMKVVDGVFHFELRKKQ